AAAVPHVALSTTGARRAGRIYLCTYFAQELFERDTLRRHPGRGWSDYLFHSRTNARRVAIRKLGSSPTVREGMSEPGAVATGSITQLRLCTLAIARDPDARPPSQSGYCPDEIDCFPISRSATTGT